MNPPIAYSELLRQMSKASSILGTISPFFIFQKCSKSIHFFSIQLVNLVFMESIKDSKFLVVDDSITIRKIICANLQKMGVAKIFQAKDGEEAFRIAIVENVDIVITDHNMLGMNGLKLVSKLRNNLKTENVFIIAMSSEFNEDLKAEYGFFGVAQFIHKPFNMDTFKKAIESFENNTTSNSMLDKPTAEELDSLLSQGSISAHKDGDQIVFTFEKNVRVLLRFNVMLEHARMYNMFELD